MKFPPCPKCGKRGLHYANHPHARGYKDYEHAKCRYCKTKFKLKPKEVSKPNVKP